MKNGNGGPQWWAQPQGRLGTILVHNYRWALLSSYLSVGSPSMLLSTLPASHVELTTLTPPSHIVQSVPQYTIRRKSTSRSHRLHLQVDAKTVDSTQVTRLGQNTAWHGTSRLDRFIRRERPMHCELLLWCALALCSVLLAPVILLYYLKKLLLLLWRMCFPLRIDCRSEPTRLGRSIGRVQPIPHITKLGGLCYGPALPYVQHAESLSLMDPPGDQVTNYQLPRNLRWLHLDLHRTRVLHTGWLPSQLTVLRIIAGREDLLQPGVLPQSLLTLLLNRGVNQMLHYAYDEPYAGYRLLPLEPIGAGVLPSRLQSLIIEWQRPMTDLVLPASLTRLDLHKLPDQPMPVGCLPVGLQALRIISHSFSPQNLRGALPCGLRELHLRCSMKEPLPSSLLAQVPQLEELDLDHYPHRLTASNSFDFLSRLRVLRVGLKSRDWRTGLVVREPIDAHELPASLRRLIVVPCNHRECAPLDELELMTASHPALVVEYEPQTRERAYDMDGVGI